MKYESFLKKKTIESAPCGFDIAEKNLNENMFQWQKDVTRWGLKRGRAALFEGCGLGKTIQQLEWAKQIYEYTKRPILIIAPLAVSKQTRQEGKKFGFEVNICRKQADVKKGINITNYEMIEHFNAEIFGGIVLDESSILKGQGSKTREIINNMFSDTKYKLSCTATPAPNDYMELGHQAEFLGIMKQTEMLAEFFTHDGGETSKWRLKGHAEHKFWEWLAAWSVVLTKPSDLGYPDDGYILPGLNIEHCIIKSPTGEQNGQMMFTCDIAQTLLDRRKARRNSLTERCAYAKRLIESDPDNQWLIWCDLNSESEALAKMINGATEIRGSDSPERKERIFEMFSNNDVKYLVTKPSIAGWGLNWQTCHNMIFVGLSDSYEMMYQAIRRCYRFGQTKPVNVYIITSEAEGAVKVNIERKERQANVMINEMVKHTRTILESEIRGVKRQTTEYNPKIEMILPKWLIAGGRNEIAKSKIG